MAIEDQLTFQRNWNLHPSNPNPDMTGLKDTYKSREESKNGQIRMEINAVSNRVTITDECGCAMNHLGNCYGCNNQDI